MKRRHWPLSFLLFSALGVACGTVGLAAQLGVLQGAHPLFNDDLAGWALMVSAIALLVTGGFPLVLRRLAEHDER